ncbi:MAG: MFS transporter, partial [Candidatus Parvarchaeota archaeon]
MAPIFITLARILQGFGAGGEWGGAGVYLTELGGKTRRGFFGSLQQTFILGSVLIGLVVALVITSQASSFVNSIGWRLPFIVGGLVLIPFAWYLRSKMDESKAFDTLKDDKKILRNPVKKAFTTDLKPTLIILFGTAAATGLYYTVVTFMPTFIES